MKVATAAYNLDWLDSWAQYEDKLERWVSDAAGQGAELLVFPEYGAMELSTLDGVDVAGDLERSILAVSDRMGDVQNLHQRLAQNYKTYILGASAPVVDGPGRPVNRAAFYAPDGKQDHQDKQIMTRFERESWDIAAGGPLKLFDTALGKIGVLICYDSEFPELARHLADQGALMLFVPFCTDERQGYLRVRYCSQARAIENQCYVATAGVVGNIPDVENMDIHYATSHIFTPCDFPFARDGIAAEASANTETIIFADLNLNDLRLARQSGSVQNYNDRRYDLYDVRWAKK